MDTGGGEMLHAVGKCPPQVKEKCTTQVAGVRGRSPLVSQLCGPYETVITQQSYTLYHIDALVYDILKLVCVLLKTAQEQLSVSTSECINENSKPHLCLCHTYIQYARLDSSVNNHCDCLFSPLLWPTERLDCYRLACVFRHRVGRLCDAVFARPHASFGSLLSFAFAPHSA